MWIPSVEQVGLIGGTIGGAAFIAFVIYTVISKDFKLGVRGIVAALACIAASAAVWWVGANLYWIGPVLGIATVVGALVAGALAVWVHIKKIEVWLGWDITGDGKVG